MTRWMNPDNFNFLKLAREISYHLVNLPYDNGDLSDLGNEIGIILGKSLPQISEQDLQDFIAGLHRGIDLSTPKVESPSVDEIYQKYHNAWMRTLNDPLSKSEFIARAIADPDFARIWGFIPKNFSENSIQDRKDD
jgi:2-keto-4-pentenoate hydratase/2-oxohepta-3-ene-1,7-dioic acid hydratase in catechol pathway